MGCTAKDATSFTLPPGCRFYPSEEQILCYYLPEKNGGDHRDGINVIKEINLYNFDPFNLPDASCYRFGRGGRRRHWFCFVARKLKDRRSRRAGGGYWRRKGRIRVVSEKGAGKVVVGLRKCFAFYLGESPKTAMRTDWFMYEYALPNAAAFVLCRIFVKSPRGNIESENVLSSCAEESVARVRHIGIQFNGVTKSATEEEVQDEKKDILNFPVESVSKLENPISEPHEDWTVSTGHFNAGATLSEAVSSEEILGLLEGDYMELNDLLCPLLGFD
ncbi:unnamed protein product [Cuscuta epithymum]|uniref:NAC domain-containing protein n=1 Tax=Cuscuta epithymum TaxID=186058 RepID=A0AAV0CMB4_9ASTE|nr:unnamed protein product [Cuscuta epithymum]